MGLPWASCLLPSCLATTLLGDRPPFAARSDRLCDQKTSPPKGWDLRTKDKRLAMLFSLTDLLPGSFLHNPWSQGGWENPPAQEGAGGRDGRHEH